MDATDVTSALEERLARYPPERYPVQHATAQFHLGVALLDAGAVERALAALAAAARLFDPQRLPLEHAKALNALGAALRVSGRLPEAAEAFRGAAGGFASREQPLEQGAAMFNLGLVQRDSADEEQALHSFRAARELLDAERVPGQASAAAREHGATLFALGRLEEAAPVLADAVATAERGGDLAALGGAANVLGLVQLASGRPAEAAESFRSAAGANPRSIRPGEYAMAKANLALAYEQKGDAARARMSARQALALPAAPQAVVEQSRAVVERLGSGAGDVLAVLDEEAADRWPAIVREDVTRWVDAGAEERRAEAAAWIAGEIARPDSGPRLAEALLGALLELPPAAMDTLIRSLLEALAAAEPEVAARFRSEAWRAIASFQPPQEERLRDRLDHTARELGQEPEWGY